MNALRMLRTRRPEPPAPPVDAVNRSRAELMARIGSTENTPRSWRGVARLVPVAAGVTLLVAVLALLMVKIGVGPETDPAGPPPGPSTLPAPTVTPGLPAPVTLSGVGGVAIGMTKAEVERTWGVTLRFGEGPPNNCAIAPIPGTTRGFAIFLNERLAGVSFTGGSDKTDTGIGIGASLAQVEAAYPEGLVSKVDDFNPDARDLFYQPEGPSGPGLHFDISPEGVVSALAYGNDEALHLVEGCA